MQKPSTHLHQPHAQQHYGPQHQASHHGLQHAASHHHSLQHQPHRRQSSHVHAHSYATGPIPIDPALVARRTAESLAIQHKEIERRAHLVRKITRSQHHTHIHLKHHEQVSELALKFVNAFRPIQYVLTAVGQFPVYKRYYEVDGTFSYHFRWYRPEAFLYFLALILQFCLIIVMLYNSITILTKVQYLDKRPRPPEIVNQTELYEIVLVSRYRHAFITIWINIICAFVSQVRILLRVKDFENYFGYWTRTTQRHHLDVGEGIWKFAIFAIGCYGFYVFLLGVLYATDFSASFRGIPSLMAIMLFKMVTPDILNFDDRTEYEIYLRSPQRPYLGLYQHIGAATFVLILIWSKSIILIFIFKCKLLQRAFALYNQRIYSAVIRGKSLHAKKGKLTPQSLFKDHCCMLDLLEATDQLFSSIFEPFIGLHMAGLIHELYYVLLNAGQQDIKREYQKSFDNQYYPRPNDWVFSTMMVGQYIVFLLYVARIACKVGEQAMDGLEVLRRSSMIGRESDEDLFFHFTMYQSFCGRAEGCLLRCGGFFRINKQFMAGMFGTFLGYFIILQQFHPTFEHIPQLSSAERTEALAYREQIGKFLFRLEHLTYCHWIREPDDPCPFPELQDS